MKDSNNITSSPLSSQLEKAETSALRAVADLQNFQRRLSEQQANWSTEAISGFIQKIIPNFLELQLGIEHSKDETVKKVVGKFLENLEKNGLEKINPAAGEDINPQRHEVLMAQEGDPGKVVNVLEPGWAYQNNVITPAKISGAIA